ncbi:hypothetical protein AB0D57_26115 [Streptomyces sp. NPDC048275]|uniref:hypothetical protein n=1 Tax=Streptomyces sp. NPDC048275 TaxID=3155629 RepID=UPI0033DF29FA
MAATTGVSLDGTTSAVQAKAEEWITPKPQHDAVSAALTTAISPELRGLGTLRTRSWRGFMDYAVLERQSGRCGIFSLDTADFAKF